MQVLKKKLLVTALALLIISSLLAAFDSFTSGLPASDVLNLHGPPMAPIHFNNNITLKPIHMHSLQGLLYGEDLAFPLDTDWHELYPDYCTFWNLSSWEDMDQNGMLNHNDQIDMTDLDDPDIVEWFHVDRLTITILLSGPYTDYNDTVAKPTMAIELKMPAWWYDPITFLSDQANFMGSLWHEVWQGYSNVYQLTSWADNGDQWLSVCDSIDIMDTNTGIITYWHVEDVATDIILRWKMMDPIGTFWHEIWPNFCNWHELTSWTSFPDPWCDRLSPGDEIDMINLTTQETNWYFVDRITITINVTRVDPDTKEPYPDEWMKLELKTSYEYWYEMYYVLKEPLYSIWHEAYPNYCNDYEFVWWDPMDPFYDNCNAVLDPCDYIYLLDLSDPFAEDELYHITDMTYDLIVNKKIADPVCTDWDVLYPDDMFGEAYHIDEWVDNYDGLLSPSDYVGLTPVTGGSTEPFHVDDMTITAKLMNPLLEPDVIFIEADLTQWGFEYLYFPKIIPYEFYWILKYPFYHENGFYVIEWEDNCNGVLDFCDNLTLIDDYEGITTWHVEEVAIDMWVTYEEPPPPFYWKASYPEYAPSGVPDFDQNQFPLGLEGWCGPTAVGDSLWWMDSRYHPSTLLTAYVGAVSEHDPSNVNPFISHLAFLMDTQGQRTTIAHTGTGVWDMQAGITQYLSWSGVNPLGDCDGDGDVDAADLAIVNGAMGTAPGGVDWDLRADIHPATTEWPIVSVGLNVIDANDLALVNNNLGKSGSFYEHTIVNPDFYMIEEEVERCQDVVLLLGFWVFDPTGGWYREKGHYVTVAGINSATQEIAISDPDNDAFENGVIPKGRVPVPHPAHIGNPFIHNNASLVSHDIYPVIYDPCPGGDWSLAGYPHGMGQGDWHVQIEFAVITSPSENHDVAVTDVNVCCGASIVHGGRTVPVNVTVANEGDVTETFDVTVYWNATNVIQTIQFTLLSGATNSTVFSWDTTGLTEYLNYTISAYAQPVAGEIDLGDNTYVYGDVTIVHEGDNNNDGKVRVDDILAVALAFGTDCGGPANSNGYYYESRLDVNCDKKIRVDDILATSLQFGWGPLP